MLRIVMESESNGGTGIDEGNNQLFVRSRRSRSRSRSWKVNWVLEQYKEVEDLLKEFLTLFTSNLISLCLTTICSVVYGGFEAIEYLFLKGTNFGVGHADILILASLIFQCVSPATCLFGHCEESSSLTQRGLNFLMSFRNSEMILELPEHLRDKV